MQQDAQSIVDTSSISSNNLLPLTTQEVIPETMLSTCNAMLLRDKLKYRNTWPGWCLLKGHLAL